MKSKIVRIGNSRGVRIPKAMIDELGLEREIEIYVEQDRLVISRVEEPRAGWGRSFGEMADRGDDGLLDDGAAGTAWDGEDWEWK
jgi:antitoxin MazE